MRKLIASMVVLAGTSLAVPAMAADPTAPGSATPMQSQQSSPSNSQMNKSDLVGRKVLDSKGKQVGEVKDVITDPQGAPLNVIVATSKKDVALSPDEIKLASNDTLKATKTAKEINQLPAAPAAAGSGAGSTTSSGGGAMENSSPMSSPSQSGSPASPAPSAPRSNY